MTLTQLLQKLQIITDLYKRLKETLCNRNACSKCLVIGSYLKASVGVWVYISGT